MVFKLISRICILPENADNLNFLHKLATLPTTSLVAAAVFWPLLSFSVINTVLYNKAKGHGHLYASGKVTIAEEEEVKR